jgi:pimeloyl-ACP methyl ester carboxylesterase
MNEVTTGMFALNRLRAIATLAAATILASCASIAALAEDVGPLVIAKQGYFFVGGQYTDQPGGQVMTGHAYVDYQIPLELKHPYPIVMIHGCCSAGSVWNGTPDGRDGWAQYFLSKGYAVYIMDQVGRGRSAYVDSAYGQNNPKAPKFVEREFIAYEKYNLFPQAKLHTQWPGTGVVGDPLFDQFNRRAGVALLDKIGPAILMAHSQAGIYAWGIANDRPNLVKGMIMVEAAGSPFHEITNVGAPDYFKDEGNSKPWGFTRTPVDFDPPISDPSELAIEQQQVPDAPDLARCWRQREPARQLVKLEGIPIMVPHAEASFAIPTAHCGAAFLKQSGVESDFVKLADLGIHGNGHFMMLEKNSLQIAAVIADWLTKRVTPGEAQTSRK